ncbi:ABC transporter permease [Streptomyces sp. NPDC048527]|uniref:ABC transporter permease n=1 Tax=Streptomyces sp. NPDC048527 TaxID=3365568 RepID=UPI00371D1CBE
MLLTRGSDRREWWRISLTALGAFAATGFALLAVALGSLRGWVAFPYWHGLLNGEGERRGLVTALLLLLIPVLGFLGQCARIGAVHRDRRLASLRLAGAGPRQVRRIAALESGLACLAGSLLAFAAFCVAVNRLGRTPDAIAWVGLAAVVVLIPVLATAVSRFALRRVVSSPLGHVRRVRPQQGPGALLGLLAPAALIIAGAALLFLPGLRLGTASFPLFVFAAVVLTGAGSVWVAGAAAKVIGRRLADRTDSPTVLIAAERLRDDPWAAARTHAALLLVTVVGVGFVGVREILVAGLDRQQREGTLGDRGFYTAGINLAGGAVLIALVISLAGLAVGTAESLATRRRTLAAQVAAGVPHRVLARTLLLETALPLAPALVLAGMGGTAVYVAYGRFVGDGIPVVLPLLVPFAVYAACLAAAATSLPLLRRSVHPSELRVA